MSFPKSRSCSVRENRQIGLSIKFRDLASHSIFLRRPKTGAGHQHVLLINTIWPEKRQVFRDRVKRTDVHESSIGTAVANISNGSRRRKPLNTALKAVLGIKRQEGVFPALARSRCWQGWARYGKRVTEDYCLLFFLRI